MTSAVQVDHHRPRPWEWNDNNDLTVRDRRLAGMSEQAHQRLAQAQRDRDRHDPKEEES